MSGQVARYSVLGAVPRLLREGGPPELWRGAAAYMARHVPSTTLSFAFKDAALRLLPAPHPDPHTPGELAAAAAVHLTAGFLGGAAALFLVYPLDFATIRTQRNGGLRALYRGYGVSAVAIGAYKALYFGLYDMACSMMLQRRTAASAAAAGAPDRADGRATSRVPGPSSAELCSMALPVPAAPPARPPSLGGHTPATPSPHSSAAAAGGGGAGHPHPPPAGDELGIMERWAAANLVVLAASTLTYPLDVVRKRLVADTAARPAQRQYAGLVDCVSKIAQREGLRGFYRFYGYDMLLRVGGGVLLVMYDELKAHGPAGVARQLMGQPPEAPRQAASPR
ncbi:hypothetical protein GPECTOR_4g625 [Gonium pectorale]|uniref:ADP/ATP translocase n=1 Tax=Gonium pectorale TaxID=33097 RepID=A0A150GYZ9_GONPE|nr:hypothetical protein GPECTOR_4g625 [Gonium pectorale]|eukprot:KXZ54560.1 hypothetical protein GPECTOR_4g625 [Gonium pectorale]